MNDWTESTSYNNGFRFARGYAAAYGDAALLRAVKKMATSSMYIPQYVAGAVDCALAIAQGAERN